MNVEGMNAEEMNGKELPVEALTAMVIDDSRAMRIMLGRQLQELGYRVDDAPDGRQALDLLAGSNRRDLVVVDWNMPEMNGLQFILAVRADPRFSGVRLLVVTSESEMTQMTSALAAGADEYLMKPFTRESLAGKLELLGLAAAAT